MSKIDKFSGKYSFLSNFYICFPNFIEYKGRRFRSVEHAFQAAKCVNEDDMDLFLIVSDPKDAKFFGRKVQIRSDWESVKVDIMKDFVRQKFNNNSSLSEKLLNTGDLYLEEGNTWNDTFWGVCCGVGENNLGKILMDIRSDLRGSVG